MASRVASEASRGAIRFGISGSGESATALCWLPPRAGARGCLAPGLAVCSPSARWALPVTYCPLTTDQTSACCRESARTL